MAFLSRKELASVGFESFGRDVKISDMARFYNPGKIIIGDYTRIDDFAVLSAGVGGIEIGRNVHIAVYSSMIGQGKILLGDFVNVSSRVAIYSNNDDYSGKYMTNPTIDERYTNVDHGNVIIKKHAIIGFGAGILPNVNVGEGAVIGALSLVKRDCKSYSVYAGIPARYIKKRSKDLLKLERELLKNEK